MAIQSFRHEDSIGRYGGEEFAFIFSINDAEQARLISERLAKDIFDSSVICEDKEISVSVSIGVAVCAARDALTENELYRFADQLMYEAKKAGKNQVICNNFSRK